MKPEDFLQGEDFQVEAPPTPPEMPAVQKFGVGIVKGAGSTFRGMSEIGQKILQQTAGRVVEKATGTPKEQLGERAFMPGTDESTKLKDLLTPYGTAENLGFMTEKIAEFLAPSGMIAKTGKALTSPITGSGAIQSIARTGIRAVTEGLATGGIATLQEGEINDKVKTAAIISAMFPVAGAVIRGVGGKILPKSGAKILFSKVRPSIKDVRDGFPQEMDDVANLFKKYNIGGSLDDMNVQTQTALNKRISQLNNTLKASPAKVNPYEAFQKTVDEFTQNRAKSFGENRAITRVLRGLRGELDDVASGGKVGVFDATLIKRNAGTKGAWQFGRVDPDASAMEEVYSTFYRNMKDVINKNAPKEVQVLNREIQDLIPVSNAIIRRIPVEMRNNALGMFDNLALTASIFDPSALAILGANRLAKSGKFAKILLDASERLSNPQSAIGQRILGTSPKL